jgi:hypothetical protein
VDLLRTLVLLDLKVFKEKMEFKDRRVYPVFKESMVFKVHRVFKVFKVLRATQVLQDP